MTGKSQRPLLIVAMVVLIIVAIFVAIRTLTQQAASTAPAASMITTPSPAVTSAATEGEQTSLTDTAIQPTVTGDTTRPTRVGSAETPTTEVAPTVFDDPSVLLTPFVQPTETATPLPLTGLGDAIELSVVQLQGIELPDGFLLVADVANTAEQPVKNVSLVFTQSDGTQVGDPKPLSLYLSPGEARPGLTTRLAPDDPIIADWDTLQVHVTGAVVTVQDGQPGYPVTLDVGYPEVALNSSSTQYDYQVTVTNNTGARVAIAYQNLAFFSNDGVLLLVIDLGAHAALENGASYTLTGSIPADQPVIEGRDLVEYTDVLANISAEIAP